MAEKERKKRKVAMGEKSLWLACKKEKSLANKKCHVVGILSNTKLSSLGSVVKKRILVQSIIF